MSTIHELRRILGTCRTLAVVGLSPQWHRPSFFAAKYMQEHGYRIVPVNPGSDEVLGERCYAELAAVPAEVSIDIVDVFRRVEFIPEIVAQAIARGVPAVWLQLGLVDDVSAAAARRAGVAVVMDRCIKVEHARLLGR
jgi:predicted CoA-binding protein